MSSIHTRPNQTKKIENTMRQNRNATNKRRKFMHFSWGMLFASLNHFVPRHLFLPGMATLTATSLAVEMLRYRKGFEWMNNAMHFILGKALRKNEMDGKFTGSFYYFSGVLVTSYLFPNPCATLGICQLAIADPTASYFGRATRHVYWSRIGNGFFGLGRNKGLLGFLGYLLRSSQLSVAFTCARQEIRWGSRIYDRKANGLGNFAGVGNGGGLG
jgi:dolichol kinase